MRLLKRFGLPVLCGVALECCFSGMLALGDLRSQVPFFLLLYGVACLAFLCGAWQMDRMPLWGIAVFGLAFRLTLFPAVPSLSDDIYRYVWDGKVQFNGINPYVYAPLSDALSPLRDAAVFPRINHANLPTVYPPGAQFLFLLCYALSKSLWGIKLMVVAADCLTAWLLVKLLRKTGRNDRAVLLYFWHPLVVIECAGSGHMDAPGVALMLLALYLLISKRDGPSLAVLGGAVLVKFLPLAFAPFFMQGTRGNLWRKIAIGLCLPGAILLGYLPYAWNGAPVFGSLGTYAATWEFNGLVFDWLKAVLADGQTIRWVLGGGFAAWVGVLAWLEVPLLRAVFLISAAFLLLTPTLQPWYALWLIPLLAFDRPPAWIAFTLALGLSYHVLIRYQAEGIWQETAWVRYVEFGVLFGVQCVAFWRQKKGGFS